MVRYVRILGSSLLKNSGCRSVRVRVRASGPLAGLCDYATECVRAKLAIDKDRNKDTVALGMFNIFIKNQLSKHWLGVGR